MSVERSRADTAAMAVSATVDSGAATSVTGPAVAADPKPEPPREPALEECCGSGCSPCVFDRYDLEMDEYRQALRAWKARQPE